MPSSFGKSNSRTGFTLIELILVMAILTIAVSITAPALSNFFRGRTLDSEARRMLGVMHQAQSRAASEGLPMDVWIDANQGLYGLEAEPSFEAQDPRAATLSVEGNVVLQVGNAGPNQPASLNQLGNNFKSSHPNVPRVRFLPDGTIDPQSPPSIQLTGRMGDSLWLTRATNGLNYEIRNRAGQ